jgi:alcohol dehydrogenase class IV
MTGAHRPAEGVADGTPHVRARVVVNEPRLSASQPIGQLAASSGNALGHAVTALASRRTTAIARAVALDAIARFGRAWSGAEPDRHELALAALLSGWTVDRSGLGPHHALSQTVVRLSGLPHADVNVTILPHTVRATRERTADAVGEADRVLGSPLEALADTLLDRAGVAGLGPLASDDDLLDRAVRTAAKRPELDRVPPALTAEDVRRIYLAAR